MTLLAVIPQIWSSSSSISYWTMTKNMVVPKVNISVVKLVGTGYMLFKKTGLVAKYRLGWSLWK